MKLGDNFEDFLFFIWRITACEGAATVMRRSCNAWSWRISALAFPMRISNMQFCLPSLVNETPMYLNFSDCFSGTPPFWRELCFGRLDRHMVSVFAALIFISATEHASENLSRACWRLFWVESSSTRSSANNRRCTVRSPIMTSSQDSLLTILSV